MTMNTPAENRCCGEVTSHETWGGRKKNQTRPMLRRAPSTPAPESIEPRAEEDRRVEEEPDEGTDPRPERPLDRQGEPRQKKDQNRTMFHGNDPWC